MRELDRLLEGFLDAHFDGLTDAERQSFADFLELPDPDLHAYLVGRTDADDPDLAQLVVRIRGSVSADR